MIYVWIVETKVQKYLNIIIHNAGTYIIKMNKYNINYML